MSDKWLDDIDEKIEHLEEGVDGKEDVFTNDMYQVDRDKSLFTWRIILAGIVNLLLVGGSLLYWVVQAQDSFLPWLVYFASFFAGVYLLSASHQGRRMEGIFIILVDVFLAVWVMAMA